MSNILNSTRAYLIGHMEYANGREWRNKVKTSLSPLGIKCFDPYDKPFVDSVDEDEKAREELSERLENGDYDWVQNHMWAVRRQDLNLVDRSDLIICYIDPKIPSWGTAEELAWACRLKKPTFICVEGGKTKVPKWIYGMFPHKYFYDSVENIIALLKDIDSGIQEVDSDRWRLLRKEFR